MKQNKIFTINAALLAGQSIVAGISEVGAGITLSYSSAADINADLVNLITARNNHEQAKQTKANQRETFDEAMAQAKKFMRGTRELFMLSWGTTYSSRFTALGFNDNSLQLPNALEDVLGMLQSMKAQFAANPTQELPPLFTAARAQELYDSLVAANNAIDLQDAEITSLMQIRDEKYRNMVKRISSVYQELRMQLGPLDARWGKFGFNMPGADETPDMPTGLVVTLIGPTAVALKWEAAERAAYYRIYKKVTGVDENYVAVGSPADLDFTIEGLPAGATVEIQITAVNTGGESSRTEAVTVVMHS